jgi:hypothetical protein
MEKLYILHGFWLCNLYSSVQLKETPESICRQNVLGKYY